MSTNISPDHISAFEALTSGRFELRAGDCLIIESAGGGGYGDPARRLPLAIERDRAEGYVSN